MRGAQNAVLGPETLLFDPKPVSTVFALTSFSDHLS